ncbi:hypothetical protein SMALA_0820 [Streptomyces malaysiensis subsp. malaysiensis]|nr:hypothetical protein SMALA_0820 [Streptomyces malaysiensis]
MYESCPAYDADSRSVIQGRAPPSLRGARCGYAHGPVDRCIRAKDRLTTWQRQRPGGPRIHRAADQPSPHRGWLLLLCGGQGHRRGARDGRSVPRTHRGRPVYSWVLRRASLPGSQGCGSRAHRADAVCLVHTGAISNRALHRAMECGFRAHG